MWVVGASEAAGRGWCEHRPSRLLRELMWRPLWAASAEQRGDCCELRRQLARSATRREIRREVRKSETTPARRSSTIRRLQPLQIAPAAIAARSSLHVSSLSNLDGPCSHQPPPAAFDAPHPHFAIIVVQKLRSRPSRRRASPPRRRLRTRRLQCHVVVVETPGTSLFGFVLFPFCTLTPNSSVDAAEVSAAASRILPPQAVAGVVSRTVEEKVSERGKNGRDLKPQSRN
ncbi:hypothetical protein PIB30_080397 [Stylosanthes scabra]|uniref:Uncharacterized protein n=1 Tax=Stylosanthes scabra TaxID=79078 RepID=A0ABU6VSL3_9FABA|nr:hypothetical protein [Stylosanthes scabra]